MIVTYPESLDFGEIEIFGNVFRPLQVVNEFYKTKTVTVTAPEGFQIYDEDNDRWVQELTFVLGGALPPTELTINATGSVVIPV